MKNYFTNYLAWFEERFIWSTLSKRSLILSLTRAFSLTLFMVFFSCQIYAQQIYINEFMASNSSTIVDGVDYDDWVELYNGGSSSVNIGGMYLSDDLANPTLWQIPTGNSSVTTIPAGGYLLLWFDKETAQGPLHVDAKLGSGGEDIVLTASNGTTIIDSYTYGPQISDVSEGRVGDGNSNFDFFGVPTPNAANDSDPGAPFADVPVFSIDGGQFTGSVTLTLSGSGDIRYTTDGSEPTEFDALYNGPITISSNTPIRAKAFDAPALPSPVVTNTYLFNVSHDFPIVAYTADPDEMFDPATGIYPNYLEDIEIVVNAEFWEPNGTVGFNMLFESEVQGTGSASLEHKPLALKAKSSLGSAVIPYQVFPDLPFQEHRSLTLRNSGQDWNITMFRDAMVSSLVADLSDVGTIIKKPDMFMQGFRPAVMYLNGEYWGINNVRERIDKRYLKVHFDLDDDEVDFLENKSEAKEGDLVEWDILETFLENNSLTSDANYQYVKDNVDLNHYADYVAFNLFIDAQDWPGNNNRRWRKRAEGEKWRWISWDLDFTFGLFVPGQPWNSGNANYNTLGRMLDLGGFNWPTPDWSTLLFRRLVEKDEWRDNFINRLADQMNILYTPERINDRIDEFVATYDSEIQQHHDRWSGGYQVWDENVQKLRNFANARTNVVRNNVISEFSNVSGTSSITINLNPSNRGEVDLSTITIDGPDNGWSGTYFRGVDVPVRAYPDRGYILNNWSGGLSGNNPNEAKSLTGSTSITANFIKGSTSTQSIVINEINYNSPDGQESGDWVELYNPNGSTVNISGWYFEDEGGSFFGIPGGTTIAPGGYLLLVEDESKFNAIHPGVNNYIGEFGFEPRGFGLSGGGELITLKNADGELIDEVDYDDNSPWPTEADGDGPTLQLISPNLNNALAQSWQAIPATPGALNIVGNAQNQTISFPSIPNKLTTDGPFSISATASSGLAVNFTIVSGPATISGNTITLNGTPGTVSVQANQSGNGDYNPAPSVTRTFNVTAPNTGCNVTWTTTSNSITVSGLNAPHAIFKLFSPTWSTVYECNDNCSNPETVGGLAEGIYHIDVQLYDANWQPICNLQEDVDISGGGGCTDNDNDGFCAADDCNDNNPNIPATPGSSCNDGDSNTTNDVIQSDGCTCEGTPVGGDACDDVSISTNGNSITVSGLNTPITQVQIFNPTWQQVLNCSGDCNSSETASNLTEGDHFIRVRLYNANWQLICEVTETVTVGGGGGCTDNDNDGVCAADDCNDNNPNIPATVGTSCNDGDSNTTNDEIQSDGCTCAGTPIGGGADVGCGISYTSTSSSITITGLEGGHVIMKLFSPNWATVYDCFDDCPNPLTLSGLASGTYHLSVNLYDSNWNATCDLLEDVIIGSGSPLEGVAGSDVLFFNAMKNGRSVNLNWVTNTSFKTTSFEVERSVDGNIFEDVTETSSFGDSADELYYQTEDKNPYVGINYYRLKQILTDGSIIYSGLKKINFQLELDQVLVFPNPANDNLYINLKAYVGLSAEIVIYNQLGERLDLQSIEALTEEPVRFNVEAYNSGMYFIDVKVDDMKRRSFRFVKGKL